MFITRDYLRSEPWVALCDMINDSYNVNLYPGSTELLNFKELADNSVEVTIGVSRSSSKHNQLPILIQDTFVYQRLDFSDFFKVTPVLNITGLKLPLTTLDILEALGESNDIVFNLRDVIHRTYDSYETEYTLEAHPNSLRWSGSMKFKIDPLAKTNVSDITTKTSFPKSNYLDNVDAGNTFINGTYYVTGYDFTNYRDFLSGVKIGKPLPSPKRLIALLRDVTGFPFVLESKASKHNLKSSNVLGVDTYSLIYNGPILPRYSHRTDMNNVLVLNISDNFCTDIVGTLLIHYN